MFAQRPSVEVDHKALHLVRAFFQFNFDPIPDS